MHNLLEFLRKYHYRFLFLLLEAIGLTLVVQFNSYHRGVYLTAAAGTTARIDRAYGDAVSYLALREVNRTLTDENIRLQREAEALREQLHTLSPDTGITAQGVRERLAGYTLIPATVISNTHERANNYLVIDKGRDEGVCEEMGVVGGGGVVGIVYMVTAHHALVLPVTNRKSSISCRVRGQRYFGYLQWTGGDRRRAYVDDIPRYARVSKGQAVETSGYSAVFPPGLFVGCIDEMGTSSDGLAHKLRVHLGTDFASLRDVSVIATPYKAAVDTLRAHAAEIDPATKN